jgi:hypothetical protein
MVVGDDGWVEEDEGECLGRVRMKMRITETSQSFENWGDASLWTAILESPVAEQPALLLLSFMLFF